jgi:endonuclease/exonuclease/phosphatase family metal-dependent hydrolase
MADGVTGDRGTLLRLASYNIHRAVGSDRRRDPRRIADAITELRASIIGLQEVDWHPGSAIGGASQSEFLAHLPEFEAVEGINVRDHRGHYGNMLLTRFPVMSVSRVSLSVSGREPRGAIDARLDCLGVHLRVIVTHFGLGFFERRRQSAQIADMIAEEPEAPTVLLGDLNDWIAGLTIRPLVRGPAGPATFPSLLPVLALDRILTWRLGPPLSIAPHRSAVTRWASDHLPLVAEVGLPAKHGSGG